MASLPDIPTIRIASIQHRGEARIGLWFPYNKEIMTRVRTIPGATWSASLRCWHIPDSTEGRHALEHADLSLETKTEDFSSTTPRPTHSEKTELHSSGTTVDVPTSGALSGISSTEEEHSVWPHKDKPVAADIPVALSQGQVEIILQAQQCMIKMPYQQQDVDFLRSLAGSWWHTSSKQWMVRAIPANLEALQSHFAYWTPEAYARCLDLVMAAADPFVVELYQTPERPGFVAIKLKGYRADHDFLKGIPERNYDPVFKRWWIPAERSSWTGFGHIIPDWEPRWLTGHKRL
ncbi:MAG: hypothetical protein R2787_14380 [Saprospiraceae bacterium]